MLGIVPLTDVMDGFVRAGTHDGEPRPARMKGQRRVPTRSSADRKHAERCSGAAAPEAHVVVGLRGQEVPVGRVTDRPDLLGVTLERGLDRAVEPMDADLGPYPDGEFRAARMERGAGDVDREGVRVRQPDERDRLEPITPELHPLMTPRREDGPIPSRREATDLPRPLRDVLPPIGARRQALETAPAGRSEEVLPDEGQAEARFARPEASIETPSARIPDLDESVVPAAREPSTCAVERHRAHAGRVCRQAMAKGAGLRVPDPDGVILASGREQLTVR